MNTAQIIVSQIRAIDPMALMAWGARDLVNMGNGVKFKTSGMTPWKGWVYIRYNQGRDLYEIDFFRLRKAEVRYDQQIEDVYAEDLVRIIDSVVG